MSKITQLLLLHPDDNVLVCVAAIHRGDQLAIDNDVVSSPIAVQVGHKVARWALFEGDKVIKYGAPIGSMSASAVKGEHVHMHNMGSDYIPSHTRTRQRDNRSDKS